MQLALGLGAESDPRPYVGSGILFAELCVNISERAQPCDTTRQGRLQTLVRQQAFNRSLDLAKHP